MNKNTRKNVQAFLHNLAEFGVQIKVESCHDCKDHQVLHIKFPKNVPNSFALVRKYTENFIEVYSEELLTYLTNRLKASHDSTTDTKWGAYWTPKV